MEESSGDEGNMLESFIKSSNILKKGAGGATTGSHFNPEFRPVPTAGGVYAKNKQS